MMGNRTPRSRKILYVAPMKPGNTSLYRYEALERIGQQVVPFASDSYDPASRYLYGIRYRYPLGPLVAKENRDLLRVAREVRPEVVWFDKPITYTPETVEAIKALGAKTVCYNQDNPFGPRNDGCWRQFMRVYRLFDLHCLFRKVDVERYTEWGLPFIRIALSFDRRQHFPPPAGWSDQDRTRELAYTGSPLEKRAEFLTRLGEEQHLPVSIAGPHWDEALTPELRTRYVVGGMMKDSAYRESIWKSKINLAFVTRMNEEDVAHKSFEITACGQFLLAERSPGHQEAFEEGQEAEFYSSLEECADKARYYLAHPAEREAIAAAGRRRAVSSGYDNDAQLAKVLARLDEMSR